ncbi:MAG: PhzF family phenazine biosynthesis protein [Pseudomonadales bacterium]|jgi:PhzF family phenazine biosynthesis protein|nr:PhzF family phenazine biosynthesis protein [Pseudomonadales bacterium]
MTLAHRFKQVDVFGSAPGRGNPVAVVFDADALTTVDMQRFANWTNLSETTFLLAPTTSDADYRVRIFTPDAELPFAGHPTLGTCHAWLEAGHRAARTGRIVQECGVGLVTLRHDGRRLAFAAPPLRRNGPVAEADLLRICRVLRVEPSAILRAQWVDNGPGWVAVMLRDAAAVRALEPDFSAGEASGVGIVGSAPLGIVGRHAAGPAAIEVRAFFRANGVPLEDPVTGSLNAALGQWLLRDKVLTSPYLATQGAALGRAGEIHVEAEGETIWVGGDATTCIDGRVIVGSGA